MSLSSAEQQFRCAFQRLKENRPEILPPETKVSMRNVAKEAGKSPTALKTERFPSLALEIKSYMDDAGREKENSTKREQRRKANKRSVEKRLADTIKQRDRLESIVAAQEEMIEDLQLELEVLKKQAGKVVSISSGRKE